MVLVVVDVVVVEAPPSSSPPPPPPPSPSPSPISSASSSKSSAGIMPHVTQRTAVPPTSCRVALQSAQASTQSRQPEHRVRTATTATRTKDMASAATEPQRSHLVPVLSSSLVVESGFGVVVVVLDAATRDQFLILARRASLVSAACESVLSMTGAAGVEVVVEEAAGPYS